MLVILFNLPRTVLDAFKRSDFITPLTSKAAEPSTDAAIRMKSLRWRGVINIIITSGSLVFPLHHHD